MKVETLISIINADFYTGVPDSQLRPLCDYLCQTYGTDSQHHIIAANEGNCVALAAGYYLATQKIPVVYLQNSGEGNIINPVASLLHRQVYCIPVIFLIGWRGEPGVHDEPQHLYQGAITLKLLEDMDIMSFVIGRDTTQEELCDIMSTFRQELDEGRSVAFVVRKGALSYAEKTIYQNAYSMQREEVIRHIIRYTGNDPVVSTTGKASRELFESRVLTEQGHQCDFLTVGSMGHSSSIALGIALHKPNTKIWCIDGDGAALMHLGAMTTIGAYQPSNLIHIILNNEAHESVGGMPTASKHLDFVSIAKACGYPNVASVESFAQLDLALTEAKQRTALSFIEVKCAIGSRSDLGRPTSSALENKKIFMDYLRSL